VFLKGYQLFVRTVRDCGIFERDAKGFERLVKVLHRSQGPAVKRVRMINGPRPSSGPTLVNAKLNLGTGGLSWAYECHARPTAPRAFWIDRIHVTTYTHQCALVAVCLRPNLASGVAHRPVLYAQPPVMLSEMDRGKGAGWE
jgi:hypothetical protein